MPFASKEKRNKYQREYKRKQAAELKRLKAQVKSECVICQRKVPTDYEGYCQQCHDEIAARNVREGST